MAPLYNETCYCRYICIVKPVLVVLLYGESWHIVNPVLVVPLYIKPVLVRTSA